MADADRSHPLELEEFRAALDAMQDHVAIGAAVREGGAIVDFRLLYVNDASVDRAGRPIDDLVGELVCTLYPNWVESGLLARFAAVVETGEPWVDDRFQYHDVAPDGSEIRGWWSLSVAPFGDGYIASSRDVTDLVLDEVARREEQAEAERNRLAVSLLQAAALPAELPSVPRLQLAARYQPAAPDQPVGGDWYDALDLDDGRVGLVIADVAGHGPDAAAFMVQVRNVVRAFALEHDDPATVLERANDVVARLDDGSLFATCCYLVLDVPFRRARWAIAGHPPPIRILAGAEPGTCAGLLDASVGPPLGVQATARYRAESAELTAGDVLVLLTDGLVEDRAQTIEASLQALVVELDRALAGRSPCDAQRLADGLIGRPRRPNDDAALLVACLEDDR